MKKKTKPEKLAERLAYILTRFNDGQKITKKEVAERFNTCEKTIERDIERLSELPIEQEGKYHFLPDYALGKLSFKDIKNFAAICSVNSLFPSLSDGFITDILNSKINNAYLVKNQGFENLHHKKEEFDKLKNAILNRQCVKCLYNDKHRTVHPYKLVNNNGIWYLVADDDGRLKNFTFSKIKNLKILEDTSFTPNEEFMQIIDKNEVNWFSQTVIEVTLEIDNGVKEFFDRKEIFPNKKIIDANKKTFTLVTNISYDEKILQVVKYWLPHIRIISPVYLQQKLLDSLQEYIKTTQPVHGTC